MEKEKFYISTAIDYPTGKPHIGHAYEKITADIIARWHTLLGKEVFFLTGTDEHGLKVQKKAKEANLSEIDYVNKLSAEFELMCKKLFISNNRFIRTTEDAHTKVSQTLFSQSNEAGDIYLDKYSGLYCTECEAYYLEKDLKNGLCKVHGKKPELLSEESYFFKLSKYKEMILKFIEKNPKAILPKHKANEIKQRLKQDGLKDLSVSRVSFDWGIKTPINDKHVIYVWFDALINYLTGVDYPSGENFKKFWPADIHLIGKDILWFHTVIWWSILKSSNIPLPKTVYAHGFIKTESGQKMSKSLGNVIDPMVLADKYNPDSLRYFLAKEVPFGEDGYFSEEKLIERHNQELANDLGNLVYRTLSMIEKYNDSIIPKGTPNKTLQEALNIEKIQTHMGNLELHLALSQIMSFVKEANKYINDSEPWKAQGEKREEILYNLADSIRIISFLLHPFIPNSSKKIAVQLGIEIGTINDCKLGLLKSGSKITKGKILFEKLEIIEDTLPELKYKVQEKIEEELHGMVLEITKAKVKRRTQKLERLKKEVLKKVNIDSLLNSSLMKEYGDLMGSIDCGAKPAPELLLEYVKKSKRLPNINTIADSYNLLSFETGIVMGAYDRNKFNGNINLIKSKGIEDFTPLALNKKEKIQKGEYIYVDDSGKVITRLLSKQSENVKVDLNSKNIAIIVQGNKAISKAGLKKTAHRLGELIKEMSGAEYRIVESKSE